eukprot:gene272-388_t
MPRLRLALILQETLVCISYLPPKREKKLLQDELT